VKAYDPVAADEAKRAFALDLQDVPEHNARLTFESNEMEAAHGADALVILTEWKVFKSPDFGNLKSHLKAPVIFDGRNLYEPEAMSELGIEYHTIGRRRVSAAPTVRAKESALVG
jgi:UDPglucose 6-dehydrogenase